MAAGEGQVPGSVPGCGTGERCGHSDKSPQRELLLQRADFFFFFDRPSGAGKMRTPAARVSPFSMGRDL